MSEGKKYDGGKLDWLLLLRGCRLALAGVLRVLTFGAKKYGENNWQLVEPHSRYTKALYRHMQAVLDYGLASRDEESGELHIHHVTTNALFLGHFAEKSIEPATVDSRPRVLSGLPAGPLDDPRFRPPQDDVRYPFPTGVVPRGEEGFAVSSPIRKID